MTRDSDLWLTQAPEAGPCRNCGHDEGEHGVAEYDGDEDGRWYQDAWIACECQVKGCICQAYTDEPPEREPREPYED